MSILHCFGSPELRPSEPSSWSLSRRRRTRTVKIRTEQGQPTESIQVKSGQTDIEQHFLQNFGQNLVPDRLKFDASDCWALSLSTFRRIVWTDSIHWTVRFGSGSVSQVFICLWKWDESSKNGDLNLFKMQNDSYHAENKRTNLSILRSCAGLVFKSLEINVARLSKVKFNGKISSLDCFYIQIFCIWF